MAVIRTILLLPYVVPVIALALFWRWMLDGSYGIVSAVLQSADLLAASQSPLALPDGAMASVIARQYLAGLSLRDDFVLGGPARHSQGAIRGRSRRWREHVAGIPLRDAAASGRHHQDHVRPAADLDRDLLRHRLAHHPRRPGRRHRALADLDLSGDDGFLPLRLPAPRWRSASPRRSLSSRFSISCCSTGKRGDERRISRENSSPMRSRLRSRPSSDSRSSGCSISSIKPSAELFMNPPRILPSEVDA